MGKDIIRLDQVLQRQLYKEKVDVTSEQDHDGLFVTVRSRHGESSIEIEDNTDWIAIRTNFYFVAEYSVTPFTYKDRLRKKATKIVVDMVTDGCEVQYVFRNGKLLRTDFFVKGKKEASTITRLSFFGRKIIKKEYYYFQ